MADEAPALDDVILELEALASGDVEPEHYYRWVAPTPLADGSVLNGYCDYMPAMDRLWSAFADSGYEPRPANYIAWLDRAETPFDPGRIARMDKADLRMLLLAIRRHERFCDGHWTAMLRDGIFLAIARRILAIRA